jgi:hypothetical protein
MLAKIWLPIVACFFIPNSSTHSVHHNSNYRADSIVGIATSYGLDGPGIKSRWGARFSAPVQTGPGAQPASCTMGTGSFLGVKSSRGVTLTPHPLLVPWSWKGRAIPLLPLWAVQPVQSLSACTNMHFFTFTTVIVRSFVPSHPLSETYVYECFCLCMTFTQNMASEMFAEIVEGLMQMILLQLEINRY